MSTSAILLGLCQFLFMSAAAVSIAFSGILGRKLADSPAWATLPFLATTAVTAALALLLPSLIQRYQYKPIFYAGCLAGIVGGALTAGAVTISSFALFCVAAALLGIYQASALYYRFAAADASDNATKGQAVAWVMSGGIPAALLGPLLGAQVAELLPVPYTGSYVAAAVLALLAIPLVASARLPSSRAPAQPEQSLPFSFASVMMTPRTVTAVCFCAGGYGVMMLVMLATPLSLSAQGHTASHAASVIQWHLLGMFAPSLLTGRLIDRWHPLPVGITGGIVIALACGIGLLEDSLLTVHAALMLVGLGWNLMYMSGTSLLTRIEDSELRTKSQGITEFATFIVMTVIAGATGWIYYGLGWHRLLWVGLAAICVVTALGAAAQWRQRLVMGSTA